MEQPANIKKQGGKYSSWQLVKDIAQLLKPYKWRFIFSSIIRLLGDLAWLYPAVALASIVTFFTHYKSGQSLISVWIALGLWFAAAIIRNLSQFFAKYFGYQVSEKIGIDSELKTVKHMCSLDMAWHERENAGNKIKRIQNAGDGFNKILRIWFNSIIEIGVNIIAINVIIARFDATVLVVTMIFLVTYFFISNVMIRKAGVASYIVNAQEENVSGLFFETISNVRTVKAMSMAKTLYGIIVKGMDDLYKKLRVRIFWYQTRGALVSSWAAVFRILIIAIIIIGIVKGHYEIGFLILFNTYFVGLREAIDELSTSMQDFVTSKFSIARMKDVLNEPITIDDERGKVSLPSDWQTIAIKNVSFSYGENKVLDSISFEVRRGEKVGIVGLSGAGKSTLFKLLLKEREKFDGDILFDGVSIKKIRKNDYFQYVSVVLQDTEVFNFSLRENITITNDKQKNNQKLLKQALSIARVSDFIDKLPQGIETVIGEKGIRLSGGERQRLGIARAVFKEPQILLLDEATSHLDLESEEKIRDSLHKFFENVTAVVIAHRLTTIKEMNKILVIENGKIIESGDFKKLYANRGRFYELWEKQRL